MKPAVDTRQNKVTTIKTQLLLKMALLNLFRSKKTVDDEEKTTKTARTALIRRLDLCLMTYACASYSCSWHPLLVGMKYIDQTAHSNAYVSGMKEELNMYGTQYNVVNSMFSAGYCIGSVASQVAIAKFRPSRIIPSFELAWSLLIMVNAAAKNVKLLYGMRFLIGFLESIAYPGFVSVLASWYTPAELAKRVAFLQSSSAAGSMFSGYLQSAILATLDGRHGMAGWRWLFIIDGLISIPIAVAGYWLIPDTPNTSRALWLSPTHLEEASARMAEVGRAPRARLTWKKVVALFKEYPVWIVIFAYPAETMASQTITYFNLFLKSKPDGHKFTTYQVNLIPTGGQALQLIVTIGIASLSDKLRSRVSVLVGWMGIGLIGEIILSVWDVGFNAKFAGYMLVYCTVGAGSLMLTWYSEIFGLDAEIRTLIIGLVNGVCYAWIASWPFLMFPANQAPHYKYGYKIAAGFYSFSIVATLLMAWIISKRGLPYANVPKSEPQDDGALGSEEDGQDDNSGKDVVAVNEATTGVAVVRA
ncbi:hypothetical protein IAT38_001008 [Cryptococcus sp. DSM 104549]